ncbi:hypothetical protein [Anoxybacteroides tepidamans]|uniref:hypothetical protein n=1 Tax=Anoxybacteroides tepidamans TaxID=265948 RepID=UPI001E43076B|nr:hypothetical protein [Anoxybacillus tepidamans]
MSTPNIPNITPTISLTRCETIHLLLSSIALEEIGLSHILNAEGEKLQHFLKTCPDDLHDYLQINESINQILRTIVKSQILLQFKLENVISLDCDACCESSSHCEHHDCSRCCKKCSHHKHCNCDKCHEKHSQHKPRGCPQQDPKNHSCYDFFRNYYNLYCDEQRDEE